MKDNLVIVVGKTYLTRNGGKARVLCTDRRSAKPVVALVTSKLSDREIVRHYKWHGRLNDHAASGYDLVKEYVEPPKPREAWILCGPEGIGSLSYESETEAYDLGGGDGTEVAILFREVLPNE